MTCATTARRKVAVANRHLATCRPRVRQHERRRDPRYRLNLAVVLPTGIGETCDISETGVLFETDHSPFRVMDPIEFDLVFLSLDEDAHYVRCQGMVVRVEPSPVGWRIAAAIDRYTLPYRQD